MSALLIACQKKEQATDATEKKRLAFEHPVFNKRVGGPVDRATAERWKRNLSNKLRKNKIATTVVYYLPAPVLESLISIKNTAGVLFYFDRDSAGLIHLAPIGVDESGWLMATPTVTTTSGVVSWKNAKDWREQFKQQHPDVILGYFWGSIAIESLLAEGTELVRIELGMDNEGSLKIMYSNAAAEDPATLQDRNVSCPLFCPLERTYN